MFLAGTYGCISRLASWAIKSRVRFPPVAPVTIVGIGLFHFTSVCLLSTYPIMLSHLVGRIIRDCRHHKGVWFISLQELRCCIRRLSGDLFLALSFYHDVPQTQSKQPVPALELRPLTIGAIALRFWDPGGVYVCHCRRLAGFHPGHYVFVVAPLQDAPLPKVPHAVGIVRRLQAVIDCDGMRIIWIHFNTPRNTSGLCGSATAL